MNIDTNTNNIHFEARYCRKSIIKELVDSELSSRKVACVRLDPFDKNDYRVLQNSSKSWGQSYATDILTSAKQIRKGKRGKNSSIFYALTTQNRGFKNLDEAKILLLCEVQHISKSILNIPFYQVNPNFAYPIRSSFCEIGRGCMNTLKRMYSKTMTVKSDYAATGFYEKNNFKIIDADSLSYAWIPRRFLTGKAKID